MLARWWDQGRQAAEEIDRRERDLGATVAQGTGLAEIRTPSLFTSPDHLDVLRQTSAVPGGNVSSYVLVTSDERLSRLRSGNPRIDPRLEDVHWQRAGSEHLVVEGADVECGSERRARLVADPQDRELAAHRPGSGLPCPAYSLSTKVVNARYAGWT